MEKNNFIENICPYTDAIRIESRLKEVTLVKLSNWSELFFDTREDIDIFINDLIKARNVTFKENGKE